jgi:uncharacterized protein YegL
MSYNRRLPVYLLLDCSESMAGEAIQAVKDGLDRLVLELRGNPMALETAALSIISFASTARQVMPLTDLLQFNTPTLKMGSGTALGAALDLWLQCMQKELVITTETSKGDYKPMCFLMTDGQPTDTWEDAADRARSAFVGKKGQLIAVACGPDADTTQLMRITEEVIVLTKADEAAFARFFKWVSASVTTASKRIEGDPLSGGPLAGLPYGVEVAQPGQSAPTPSSDRYVFLHSRCVKDGRFYIIRFGKQGSGNYAGVAGHPIDDFETEDAATGGGLKVSVSQLQNPPPCPYCHNVLWAKCRNGHVHCCPQYQGTITLTCPWCKVQDSYVFANFDVGRGKG